MIVTTTPSVEGSSIESYEGIVTGEAIIGANIVKDFIANITDIVGGRSGQYEEALRTARQEAIREMSDEARGRGADAVVAVDIDYEVLGRNNGMLMVSASGTAVKLA